MGGEGVKKQFVTPRKPIIEFADGSTSKYERNTCAGYLV